ncbi:hypothetical protein X737_27925 [Mesorhizobium sp. L48C026A00]|nr:hypothetical protein X737_27925 [Mesorhizobium sp. L48C026A00]
MKSDRIKVNQALHGYSEGHRLIEGSMKLPQADARTMLVLSDASASGARIPADGYLTGYPLPEAGKYALARTWAAPEMSRPGCVWTHSLLIDFADLARLASADDLLERFMCPSKGVTSTFGSPIEIEVTQTPATVSSPDIYRAGQWVSALYGKPRSRITAERTGSGDDELVAAIWMQQWPRLRRTFRFCSFTVEDRSTSADIFDLQLVDGSRSSRSRMPEGVPASSVEGGDWIKPLLDDLEHPSRSGLRRFLRNLGADVTNGRAAMASLIQLFSAVDPASDPDRIAGAVLELQRLGPTQGRMGRAAAAKVILSRPDLADRRLFEFALEQVRTDQDLLGIDATLVGRAILRWRPDLLGGTMPDEDPLQAAVDAILTDADADELVEVLTTAPDAMPAILAARPDILEKTSIWRIRSVDVTRLLQSVDVDQDHAAAIAAAMIAAGRDDCSSLAVDRLGVCAVVRALIETSRGDTQSISPWLRTVAGKTDELAACLAEGVLTDRSLLIGLAAILDPDAVPNSVGQDPWVTAVEYSRALVDDGGEDILASFLFCRAMGWRSRSAGRLFFLSVQRLHEAMAARRLSDAAWRLTDRRLPWVAPWRDWDRCERLRRAVVDQFIERDLPPLEFGTVVDDGKLWSRLVDLAADSFRGRRYLERVRQVLGNGSDGWWHERARVIERKAK